MLVEKLSKSLSGLSPFAIFSPNATDQAQNVGINSSYFKKKETLITLR
jgi:hypothetical protein